MILRKFGAIAVALAIAGCGGGDESSTSGAGSDGSDNGSSIVTYQVIDGYLSEAAVYVDYNDDNVADDNEYAGLTDTSGRIDLTNDALNHRVLVKVVAGQTIDSDTGMATKDSMLVAREGNRFITPFSTLATLKNKTLEALAIDLNIDYEAMTSDFVALSSSNNDAMLIRVLARSKMALFNETLQETQQNIDLIDGIAKKYSAFLRENPSDIDDAMLLVDANGDVYKKKMGAHYEVSNMRLNWVNDDWDQSFTLCHGLATQSKLVISNCDASAFVVVDQYTGRTIEHRELLHGYTMPVWYLDGDTIIIDSNNGDTARYDLQLNELPAAAPSNVFFRQANGYGFTYTIQSNAIEEALKSSAASIIDVLNRQSGATTLLFSNDGTTYSINAMGEVTKELNLTSEEIIERVAEVYNANSEHPSVGIDDTYVRWLGGSVYAVEFDVDGERYARTEKGYHYSFNSDTGDIHYLGRFFGGQFILGLDDKTAMTYDSEKTYSNFPDEYTITHTFRQVSRETGELIALKTLSNDVWARSLNKQIHTPNGVFAFYNESTIDGDEITKYSWLVNLR